MMEVIRKCRYRCKILSNTIQWVEGHREDVGQIYMTGQDDKDSCDLFQNIY